MKQFELENKNIFHIKYLMMKTDKMLALTISYQISEWEFYPPDKVTSVLMDKDYSCQEVIFLSHTSHKYQNCLDQCIMVDTWRSKNLWKRKFDKN